MSALHSAVLQIAELDEGYELSGPADPDSNIEMHLHQRYKGLFARKDIVAGAVIFYFNGRISRRPNKYSVQLSRDKHVDFPPVRVPDDDLDYAWQYLNHSCEPNGYVNAEEFCFCALRNIAKGEELTFNYLATEYELASPFQCDCGSAKCFGFIRGGKFLTADQLAELSSVTSMK